MGDKLKAGLVGGGALLLAENFGHTISGAVDLVQGHVSNQVGEIISNSIDFIEPYVGVAAPFASSLFALYKTGKVIREKGYYEGIVQGSMWYGGLGLITGAMFAPQVLGVGLAGYGAKRLWQDLIVPGAKETWEGITGIAKGVKLPEAKQT